MDAPASGRREPLDFAARQVEQIHDHPGNSEHVPQPRQHGLGDLHRRFRCDKRAIDLVQHLETVGRPVQRGGGSPLAPQGERPEASETRRHDQPDRRGRDENHARALKGYVFLGLDDDTPAERR